MSRAVRVQDVRRQVESRLHDGWPFAALEAWIETQPLTEDERAAVWLYAFCARDRLPAGTARRLVAV